MVYRLGFVLTAGLLIFSCVVNPIGPPSGGSSQTETLYEPGPGWNLIWSDEFDGNEVNTNNWVFDIGTGVSGWGNNELQYYTSRTNNAAVTGGNLVITALQESYGGRAYTSARLKTKGRNAWQYGKIVARIRLPYGKGIWPAFWMLGDVFDGSNWPQCGEIDILEMVGGGTNGDSTVYSTLHWQNFNTYFGHGTSTNIASRLADDFHIFETEWNSNTVTSRIDGRTFFSYDISDDGLSEFRAPFFILLNVAVGGNWPGSPDGTTVFPQTMTVDWVRVYQKSPDLPAIQITYPADGSTLYRQFRLMGNASSSNGMGTVFCSVNGSPFAPLNDPSNWTTNWSTNLDLPEGNHGVRVFALDLSNVSSVTNEMSVSVTWQEPSVVFTSVPPIGSTSRVYGRVTGVTPSQYRISLWIYVVGGWWPKPWGAAPYTPIDNDGYWNCPYVTGGSDANATIFLARLVPSYTPVSALGSLGPYIITSGTFDRRDTNTGPTNAFFVPTNGQTVIGRQHLFRLSGSAVDDYGAGSVYLSANSGPFIRASLSGTNWFSNMVLLDGPNTVSVFSLDNGYHTSETNTVSFTFINDDTPPTIQITSPAPDQHYTGLVSVSGTASDSSGVLSVYISIDNTGFFTPVGLTNWGLEGILLDSGTHVFRAFAMDILSNVSPTNTVNFFVD